MQLEKRKPYYFTDKGITQIESMRNATYVGYWCGKTKYGSWAEQPLDVFYQQDPDVDAGHSHYFGLLISPLSKEILIVNAESCFSKTITGIVEDGTVYASRYRHDCVFLPSGDMIDGGRDYLKVSGTPKLVNIAISGDKFEFSELKENSSDSQMEQY